MDGPTRLITIQDQQTTPVTRIRLGKVGAGASDYGIEIYKSDGGLLLGATGLGLAVVGNTQLQNLAVDSAKVASLTVDKLRTGTFGAYQIYIGGPSFLLDGSTKRLTISDGTYNRVEMGDLGSGSFGLTLRDSSGNIFMDSGGVRPVNLVPRGNCVVTGSSIQKVGGANAWDSDTYSVNSFTGGAYVSAQAGQTNLNVMFGINIDPTLDQAYTSIDYAIYFTASGNVQTYELGVAAGPFGTYTTADVLSIAYDGTTVTYQKNGVTFRSVTATITAPLFFDSSFYNPGAKLNNIVFRDLLVGLGKNVVGTAQIISSTPVFNSQISIAANGTLSGAGGGAVTIGGLGYLGDLSATKNNVFRQTSTPTATGTGDFWYNSALFETRQWNGTSWVLISDITINKTAANITGQGIFATAPQISSSNIGTYIANASIQTAQIANLAVGDAQINNLAVSKLLAGTIGAQQIYLGNTSFLLDGNTRRLTISDGTYSRVQLGDLGSGAFGLTLRDSSGNIFMDSGGVRPINLVARGNCVVTGNSIQKVGGTAAWDSDTYSSNAFTGGAYVSAQAGQVNLNLVFGFILSPALSSTETSLDYAIYFTASGNVQTYELGVAAGPFGTYTTADVLSIAYDGTTVTYQKNGVTFRSVTATITAPLFFDSSFYNPGAKLNNIIFRDLPGLSANRITAGTISASISITAPTITGGTINSMTLNSSTINSSTITSATINGGMITGGVVRTNSTSTRVELSDAGNAFLSYALGVQRCKIGTDTTIIRVDAAGGTTGIFSSVEDNIAIWGSATSGTGVAAYSASGIPLSCAYNATRGSLHLDVNTFSNTYPASPQEGDMFVRSFNGSPSAPNGLYTYARNQSGVLGWRVFSFT